MGAAGDYLLSRPEADEIIQGQVETIRAQWTDAADACRLSSAERKSFWERLILNPDIFES